MWRLELAIAQDNVQKTLHWTHPPRKLHNQSVAIEVFSIAIMSCIVGISGIREFLYKHKPTQVSSIGHKQSTLRRSRRPPVPLPQGVREIDQNSLPREKIENKGHENYRRGTHNEGKVVLHIHVSNSAERTAKKRAAHHVNTIPPHTTRITHHFTSTPPKFHACTCTRAHSYIQGTTPLYGAPFCLPLPSTFASLSHHCHHRPLTIFTSRPSESPPTFNNIMQVIVS
jgi:hypothetical protein